MHTKILSIGAKLREIDFNLRSYTQDNCRLRLDAVEMAFEEMQIVLSPIEFAIMKE